FHLFRVTANRSIHPGLPLTKKPPGVRVLPYAVPTVNKHSQRRFVGATGCFLPVQGCRELLHPTGQSTTPLIWRNLAAARLGVSVPKRNCFSQDETHSRVLHPVQAIARYPQYEARCLVLN